MSGNNPGGINQLGSDRVPYGDAKRLATLSGEAPMSGAPLATPAVNAPRNARRQRGGQTQVTQPVAAGPPQLAPAVSYQAQLAQTWAQIAMEPGASDLVKQIAQEASVGSS